MLRYGRAQSGNGVELTFDQAELEKLLPKQFVGLFRERQLALRNEGAKERILRMRKESIERYGGSGMILFGSVARGTASEASDIKDIMPVDHFAIMKYAIFSPYEILKSSQYMEQVIEAKIAGKRERVLYEFSSRYWSRKPVLLIIGAVAPIVDDIISFLAGFAIVSIIIAALGYINVWLFAFDILFAISVTLASVLTARGFRKSTYERNYVISAAVIAVLLVAAYAYYGSGGAVSSAPTSTITPTTTTNATTSITTTSTTSVLTTTIMTYSGCSTVERDQPFHCQNPVLTQIRNLSFTLSSNDTTDVLYNLDLACTGNMYNFSTPSKYDFWYLQADGTFSQGFPGTSITSSSPIDARNLPCYNIGNAASFFNGILWVQYHPGTQTTPLQTTEIQVYFNTTSVPALTHVNSSS